MRALSVAIVSSALVLGGCSSGPEPGATGQQGSAASSSGSERGSSAAPSDDSIRGTFDVGALELALSCVGSGSPTVVVEAGDGVPSNVMGDVVKKAFSNRLRVCSYDRANTGGSDSGAALPRRSPEVVSNLHDLLAAAKVPGPYVLVGSSAGGMLVQAYAKSYPDDVSGVVAMNPVPPWDEWAKLAFPAMTATERKDETAYFAGAGSSETFDFRHISTQIASMPAPVGVPLHMLVSTSKQCDSPDDTCGRTYPAYVEITQGLSEGWPQGRFTQAGSGHELYLSDPEVVIAAVNDVVDS